jgi:trimethylamine corrinoid protein
MIDQLQKSIIEYDVESAKKIAEKMVKAGIDPIKAVNEGIAPAAKIVGDKFEKGEYFLPEVLLASEAMKAAVDILLAKSEARARQEIESKRLGKVVIATVKGDIHDIGKTILALLLEVNNFEVYDLGRDVDSMAIIQKANEVNADIIALSALMSTTRGAQKEVIDLLEGMGKRDRFIVMIGGGSVDDEWFRKTRADGWAENAAEAVELAKKLVAERR